MPALFNKKTFRNSFERVIILLLVSAMIASLIISVLNDVYAFVKDSSSVSLRVLSPLSIDELSRLLSREGIIKNPTVFKIFVSLKGKTNRLECFSGEAVLRRNMSYREIILALS